MHVLAALRAHWRELMQAIGIVTGANVALYLMFVFVIHIAEQAGARHIEEMNTVGLAMVAEWMLEMERWQLGPALYMVGWLMLALWLISQCRETAHTTFD